MRHGLRTDQPGFTLLEVLVALAVFAIVAGLAYRGLDSIATTRARLDQEMRMWRRLELVFERVNLDVTQIAPRSWKDGNNKERSSVQGTTSTTGTECQLDVLRFGPDRMPVHVRYRLKDDQFLLDLIADTDTVVNSPADATRYGSNVLLDHVERCEMSFLDSSNAWQSHWPVSNASDRARPQGVRLRLTLAGKGQFERVYYLP